MLVRLTWPTVAIGTQEARLVASIEVAGAADPVDAELMGANLVRLDHALSLSRRPSEVTNAVHGDDNAFRAPVAALGDALAGGRVSLDDFMPQFGGGEGATPAWDDLCTGVVLADHLLGEKRVTTSTTFFATLQARTTAVAWWQLKFALSGKSSLRVERFVRGFGTRPLATAEIVRVMELGHSSGSDILTGFWMGLTRRLAPVNISRGRDIMVTS